MAPFTSTWLLRQLLDPVDSFDKLQAASPSSRRFDSFDRLKFHLSSVTTGLTQVLQRSRARPFWISWYWWSYTVCRMYPFSALQACFQWVRVETFVFEMVIFVSSIPQVRTEERIMEQFVDFPLPHIMEEMMEVERSTWQNRCVLRGCAQTPGRHAS